MMVSASFEVICFFAKPHNFGTTLRTLYFGCNFTPSPEIKKEVKKNDRQEFAAGWHQTYQHLQHPINMVRNMTLPETNSKST